MATFTWKNEIVPDGIKIRQVYAIAFNDEGKVVLKVEDGKYNIAGGKPELNETIEETAIREHIEELCLKIDDIYYLGYLLVDENDGTDPYAQVRVIAKVKELYDMRPDPDNGKLYEREFVNKEDVVSLLNYPGIDGKLMIEDAIKLAKEKYNI